MRFARFTRNLLLFALLAAWLGLGTVLAAGPAGATPAEEARFVELLNDYRSSKGLGPLESVALIADLSREHSQWMADNDNLQHAENIAIGLPDGYWLGVAENIGFASQRSDTVQALHNGFVNSPGHERNMIGANYDAVGVGVVNSGNTMWVTFRFVDRPDVPAPVLGGDPPPTTAAPTTAAPTTVAPTTVAPTTVAPTTAAPTTAASDPTASDTVAPDTAAPATTSAPTTAVPTSAAPTTGESQIEQPPADPDVDGADVDGVDDDGVDAEPAEELAFGDDQPGERNEWLLVSAVLAALVACAGSAILIFRTN